MGLATFQVWMNVCGGHPLGGYCGVGWGEAEDQVLFLWSVDPGLVLAVVVVVVVVFVGEC